MSGVNVGGGRGPGASGQRSGMTRGCLQREVMVPLPTYRRASVLIGLSLVLVLVASAVDAVVWAFQSQRRIWRDDATESMRPAMSRRGAGESAVRSRLSTGPSVIAPASIAAEDPPRRSCRFHLHGD